MALSPFLDCQSFSSTVKHKQGYGNSIKPMEYGLYLYGICPAPGPNVAELQGLDQQPVQTHFLDGFAFLYSEAQQERYLASRRNLLSHEKVLEAVMAEGHTTLLPLQFGLIVQDWQHVVDQLTGPHRQQMMQLLDRLAGKREVGVKIFWNQDAELQTLLAENRSLREKRDRLEGQTLSMDQVVSIGQELESGLAARRQAIVNRFQAQLNAIAVEVVENDPMSDNMIYNAAYLIPWEAEPEFGEQVEILDREFNDRLRIRYNNFTAPYNFAQLD